MKKICITALCTVISFMILAVLAGCNGSNGFVGTWVYVVDKEQMSPEELVDYESYIEQSVVIIVREDGSGTFSPRNSKGEITSEWDFRWKANGDKMIISGINNQQMVYVYKDGRLYNQSENKSFLYFVKRNVPEKSGS